MVALIEPLPYRYDGNDDYDTAVLSGTQEAPPTRPLKLVIKGLPDNIDPEDIKNDLISKGISIVKIALLKNLSPKLPYLST
ncbi:hypothetical protein TNCV_243581 [Trichonephila clavipes]|uniref:Uncharacterized protein n=1 Tax=Trichonephila clavipes TaxID=2585209 RepID=A0A8X6W4B0_TRICX|nr:hypothetical protein TNCV_243581 [Trichonephila clavipes]